MRKQIELLSQRLNSVNEGVPMSSAYDSQSDARNLYDFFQRQNEGNTLKKLQALPQEVSETDMIRNILPTLNGAARTWLLTVPNKNQLSLMQFFDLLRARFADKRNKVGVIAALCTRDFDFKKGYIIEHIDQLMLDMAYLALDSSDKLSIVLKTLPSKVRGYASYRNVQNVEDLKSFCQQIYPPSVKGSKKVKTDEKSSRRSVFNMECDSEAENAFEDPEEDENTDIIHNKAI